MAHIQDRWYKTVELPNGKTQRVKTALYGKGLRYKLRYIGPDGRERSESFPDRQKEQAKARLIEIESDKRQGSYVDPVAGRIAFREYAEKWLRTNAVDESTRESTGSRIKNHLLPFFGAMQLKDIKPASVREWDRRLSARYAPGTRAVSFVILKAILSAAVDDGLIPKNPCSAKSVTPPKQPQRKIVPWKLDRVDSVRAGMSDRYKATVDVGAGCGLRQGEIFGLAVDDVDTEGGWLHVRRQVKRVHNKLVFGLPKNDRERRVPLSPRLGRVLNQHMNDFPPVECTLPWEDPASDQLVTACLIFTSERRCPINRCSFDQKHWARALRRAGVAPGRENGIHALRHFYASALLDAGRSIKAVSEYLGHHDPAFTLRVYAHLMPDDDARTRDAIDGLLGDDDDAGRPGDGLEDRSDDEKPGQAP